MVGRYGLRAPAGYTPGVGGHICGSAGWFAGVCERRLLRGAQENHLKTVFQLLVKGSNVIPSPSLDDGCSIWPCRLGRRLPGEQLYLCGHLPPNGRRRELGHWRVSARGPPRMFQNWHHRGTSALSSACNTALAVLSSIAELLARFSPSRTWVERT